MFYLRVFRLASFNAADPEGAIWYLSVALREDILLLGHDGGQVSLWGGECRLGASVSEHFHSHHVAK
jgi:hypothetical protein